MNNKDAFNKSNLAKVIAWFSTFDFFVFPVNGVVPATITDEEVNEKNILRCTCGEYPCGAENKNAGKHPVTRNGLKDAIHAGAAEEIAELFEYNINYNVAIRTGAESGIFVVDTDGDLGRATMAALEQTYGALPPTLTFLTGKGDHKLFQHPGMKVKTSTDVWGAKVDCRGDGGYIVAPPSNHVSGRQYKIDDNNPHKISVAPSWLLTSMNNERVKDARPFDPHHTSGAIPEWSQDEVSRMLKEIDPSCAYTDWIAVGMGLHDGGYPFSMWDQWSAGSFKYQRGCCTPHWKSFNRSGGISMGTLVDMAQRRGWKPESAIYREPVKDLSGIQKFLDKATQPKLETKPVDESTLEDIPFDIAPAPKANLPAVIPAPLSASAIAGSWGFDPMKLEGVIGDTVRWIESLAIFPQPELALFNTLAFAGAVFGRRFASPMNTRTNIYMAAIASTGSGKDHSRKMINLLAAHSELAQFIGPNAIRSDSGLVRSLSRNSSQIMMIDEFGLLLKALSDPRAATHTQLIARMMMELYSSSGSAYNHGDYADERVKPISVIDPNLCIYGVSTESTYASALKKSSIESGDLNRFIVTKTSVEYPLPNFDVPITNCPPQLVEQWKLFKPSDFGSSINSSNIKPRVQIINWGACKTIQQELLLEQCERRTGNFGALWVRLYENTIKIAMIFAISRNRTNPIFYPEDFSRAAGIVRNAIRYMESLAVEHMADSETEGHHLEMMRLLRGKPGARMGREDVMRAFRKLKKRELNDLLDSMIDGGVIGVEQTPNPRGGRPKLEYVLL